MKKIVRIVLMVLAVAVTGVAVTVPAFVAYAQTMEGGDGSGS